MPGLRVKLENLPEQPGERRISIHWFFLPTALFYLAGGVACLHEHFSVKNSWTLMFGGCFLIFLGLLTLVTFALCLRRIRQGRPPEALFTIRVRPLVLFGSMAAYMAVVIIISLHVTNTIVQALLPFVWMFGAALIWRTIARYFRSHPPKS